jgi:hypothetical protein
MAELTLGETPIGLPQYEMAEEPSQSRFDIVILINGHGELHGSLRHQVVFEMPHDMQLTLFGYAKLGLCSYDVYSNLYADLHNFLDREDIPNLNVRRLRDYLWSRRDKTSERLKETGKRLFGEDYEEHLREGWNVYSDCMERIYTPDPTFVPPGKEYHLFEILYDGLGQMSVDQLRTNDLFTYMTKRIKRKAIERSRLLYMLKGMGYTRPLLIDVSCAKSDETFTKEELTEIRQQYLPSEEAVEAILDGNWDIVRSEKIKNKGGIAGGKRKSKRRKSRRNYSKKYK